MRFRFSIRHRISCITKNVKSSQGQHDECVCLSLRVCVWLLGRSEEHTGCPTSSLMGTHKEGHAVKQVTHDEVQHLNHTTTSHSGMLQIMAPLLHYSRNINSSMPNFPDRHRQVWIGAYNPYQHITRPDTGIYICKYGINEIPQTHGLLSLQRSYSVPRTAVL